MPVTACARLYREDAYLTIFTAHVSGAEPMDDGVMAVQLDRTAFYPTGGGQPFDTGEIAGSPVIDVKEAGDGRIIHMVRVARPLAGEVEARVDWPRRFDHMQQHTGQHILSRAFVTEANAPTTSFHLGDQSCTIDVDLPQATGQMMRRVEARANEVIFSDAPVTIELRPQDQAGQLAADMKLIRELALKPGDPIRIIMVGRFDATPCGGTHVMRSGEVGAVAIRSWERFKGGTRVSFLCGARVVGAVTTLAAIVDDCVAKLSVQPVELAGAVARLVEQAGDARRQLKSLNEALAGHEARARDASARVVGDCRVIVECFDARGMDDLQLLAQAYTGIAGRVALLACVDAASGKAGIVCARSAEGACAQLKMGEIVSAVCAAHQGKGGGGATLARGGGIPAAAAGSALEDAFAMLRARLAS